MKRNILLLLCVLFAATSFAQFKSASFTIDGLTLNYQIMFPENYDENKQYPLILFLHGAGERGSDNQKQLTHGKDFFIQNARSKYPAIVIVPQCPEQYYWSAVKRHQIDGKMDFSFDSILLPTVPMQLVMTLVEDWLQSGKIDRSRVYAGGMSMGAMGLYELLTFMPNTFAAAFPICGGGDLKRAPIYANTTAMWIFHGDADGVVSVNYSRLMYTTLLNYGCDVKYTEYPEVNHNSWDYVFKEKGLFDWMFDQRLKVEEHVGVEEFDNEDLGVDSMFER